MKIPEGQTGAPTSQSEVAAAVRRGTSHAIEDYAIIGDGRTTALISRAGSIDWWCPGRFDAASAFAALLDPESGGRFGIHATAQIHVERRYIGDTNVLESIYTCARGQVRVTNAMAVGSVEGALQPDGSIVRVVECTAGEVEMEIVYEPRFDYGRVPARIREQGRGAFVCSHGADALAVRTDFPLQLSAAGTVLTAPSTLKKGERRTVAVSFARAEPLILPPVGRRAERVIDVAVEAWSSWAGRCTYDGPYRDAVLRSALVLKLLIYAPSGAIVAAPTTSLPEEIGGERNWDYRYSWLRDASLSMRALLGLGFIDEGAAYFGWLTHATNLTWPRLRVMYDVFGGVQLEERNLDHLAGYRGSRPVRVGNGASEQLQLDVYGEVVGAAYEFVSSGGILAKRSRNRLVELGRTVCKIWGEPDSGIWELRAAPGHSVHSKVMCWSVLDKLIKMHEEGRLKAPVQHFRGVRDAIHEVIEREGFDDEIGSYIQAFGRRIPDASLLRLPMLGYVEEGAPRMRSTYEYLAQHLRRNGLWFRYPPGPEDGLRGEEGAFGACTFWAAEYLARRGDIDLARQTFERGLASGNDLRLFAEEADPNTLAALGNFPQAFTHVGIIAAALAISENSAIAAHSANSRPPRE